MSKEKYWKPGELRKAAALLICAADLMPTKDIHSQVQLPGSDARTVENIVEAAMRHVEQSHYTFYDREGETNAS